MNDGVRWFFALALLATLGSAHAQSTVATFAASDAELERLGVRLGSVERAERVELVTASAEVVVPPARQVLISAPQDGVVARLLVADGEAVTAGQTLAEIDSADFLERQRDFLDAVAGADLAATQEARDRDLFDDGIIAERRLAETSSAARAARSRLDQALAQLELAGLRPADIERLREQRRLSTRIVLRAPFEGTVTAVHADVGGRLDALDPVLAIADLRELWLELHVPQESASHVEAGMRVAAAAAGAPEIVGTVTTVGGVVEHLTQTVLVRAAIDNSDHKVRAGQFLTARIQASPSGGTAFAVPTAAVTREGGRSLLFVRAGQDVLVQRIEVLGDDGKFVYVADGVDARARIAVAGVSALKALWLSAEDEGG